MLLKLALLAALGVAICNGIAAILEKISADKVARATTLRIGLLWRLLHDWPYLLGLGLDGLAWLLTLVAVHNLPLFVAQPIIALSIVVTVLIDRLLLHHRLTKRAIVALLCIVGGIGLLAMAATPETAQAVGAVVRWVIIGFPVVLAVAGTLLVKNNHRYASVALGALSGIGFGGTAITGRMLSFGQPYWHVLVNPLLWSLLAYGLVGLLLFTIALQRQLASTINAAMVAFETVVPILVGIILLGDTPKNGRWSLVLIGLILTGVGTVIMAATAKETA